MKILLFIVFGIALTVYYVDGLYSQKCKEAETSSDKLVRFIENANCTLVEKNRLFRQGLNHLQSKFQQGFAHLHNQFNGNQPSWNPMNPSADPTQPKLNPTNPTFPNFDPPTTTAPKVNLPVQVYPIDNDRIVNENPTIPGYEGLDHPIDVRMLPDEDAPKANSPTTLRFKRDASSEDDQNEERESTAGDEGNVGENVEEDAEATTIETAQYGIFLVPQKCSRGQQFIRGACRTVY